MIKAFISHNSADDKFVDWLATKLTKDIKQLEIFVDHWRNLPGDHAQNMIEEVGKSVFFIPVLSSSYMKSEFCKNERKVAKAIVNIHEFPIKLKIEESMIPSDLKISFESPDQVRGSLWCDFSDEKEWDRKYEILSKSILEKIINLRLIAKEEFYQDLEHIDVIINRDIPTNSEIKIMFKVYLERDEFQRYFFGRLSNVFWLKYINIYGYLNSNPVPNQEKGSTGYFIPYWPILDYLERISISLKNHESNADDHYELLLEIITLVSKAKIDNFRTWWCFVKILINIPNERITLDVLELIPIWLESRFDETLPGAEIIERLMPKFLNAQSTKEDVKKAEKIISHITDILIISLSEENQKHLGENEKYRFRLDSYWLKKYFESSYQLIGENCSNQVIEDLALKVKKIVKKKEDGVYKSFYEEGGISLNEPLDIFTFILKKVLNIKAGIKPSEIEGILVEYIKSEYYYFQKMAIYVISKNLKKFGGLFWDNLKSIFGDSYFRLYLVGDELKHLLSNIGSFSDHQRQALKEIIEKGPTCDFPEDERESYLLSWKQKLYKALNYDPFFNEYYREVRRSSKQEDELSSGISKVEMRSGADASPLSEEEIIRKSNQELVKFFSTFIGSKFWEGPTVDGLSELLRKTVQDNPEKYASDLEPFLNSGYLYICDILRGFQEAWKNKKQFDWEKVLEFVESYLDQSIFWTDDLKVKGSHWNADHKWVIRLIGELIQEGTKTDDWAFNGEYAPIAEDICTKIIQGLLQEEKIPQNANNDPIMHALNSAFGNIITAFIFVLLRKARIATKASQQAGLRWGTEERQLYISLFENNVEEAFTLFGQYLPQFIYIDKEMVEERINDFKKLNDPYWTYFMVGYLYGAPIYDDLYKLMKAHYKRALKVSFREKHTEERLIQHITFGYLRNHEKIGENSLIDEIIENAESGQFEVLIRYFRSQYRGPQGSEDAETKEDKDVTEIEVRIIEFWKHIYKKYRNVSEINGEAKNILTNILLLAIFLPKINEENIEWIDFSLENIINSYDAHHLIGDLAILKERGDRIESGHYMGQILLKIIQLERPLYFLQDIHALIEHLYLLGDKEPKRIADEICNKSAERGIRDARGELFLRDLFDKYKKG